MTAAAGIIVSGDRTVRHNMNMRSPMAALDQPF
jgi:hypothetical protein